MKETENKKKEPKSENRGWYVCPYCGLKSDTPLNRHDCWAKNSKPMGPNESGLYPDEYT